MSVTYWPIVGYGVKLSNIHKYINKEKIYERMKEEYPNERDCETSEVLESDWFCGYPYTYLAEFLADEDRRNILAYDTDIDGNEYLFIPSTYTWNTYIHMPKTIEEAQKCLANVLNRYYNLPAGEEYCFDYIDEVGAG